MSEKSKVRVGTIKPEDIKARRKPVPPVQPHKSPKDYDRKKQKQQDREGLTDE